MDENKFGEMLRKFRVRKGISQRSLAGKAGIDTSYISRIERGERKVTRSISLHLANILGLSQKEIDLWLISAGFVSPRLQNLASEGISKLMEDIVEHSSDQQYTR